jgi:hypothetical protein
MSVRIPAGRKVKKTPAKNSPYDRRDIDFQDSYRFDHRLLKPAIVAVYEDAEVDIGFDSVRTANMSRIRRVVWTSL